MNRQQRHNEIHNHTHNHTVVTQFSQQAAVFSAVPGHSDALELLVQLAQVAPHHCVLDVACGTGLVACKFAETARAVTGIDLTPQMLDQARALQQTRELSNLDWQIGDVLALPYVEASFDVVVTRYSFHHMLAPAAVLAEMMRVCRPGGRVVVADLCLPSDKLEACNRFEQLRDDSHVAALSQPQFVQLYRQSGLTDIASSHYKVEIELESQLRASFPQPGAEEELRRLIIDDIGCDSLGLSAYRRDAAVFYAYPIMVMAGTKPGPNGV